MSLPLIKSDNQELMLMQSRWKAVLDVLLRRPAPSAVPVDLVSGVNVINHGLGRKLQGWYVTDINAAITLYRSAPPTALTLTLTASGPAKAIITVF